MACRIRIGVSSSLEVTGVGAVGTAAGAPRRAVAVQSVMQWHVDVLSCHAMPQVLRGERSRFKGLAPPSVALAPPTPPGAASPPPETTAKAVLDAEGPEAMAQWVRAQPQVRRLPSSRETERAALPLHRTFHCNCAALHCHCAAQCTAQCTATAPRPLHCNCTAPHRTAFNANVLLLCPCDTPV